MLRIVQSYVTSSVEDREAPIGLSISREDGTRLVADLSTAEAIAFAQQLMSAIALTTEREANRAAKPQHTVRGKTSTDGWPYGTTHDMDCPACVASGSSFTASPRSETYWSS
jgi:hypothetical protein